MPRQIGAGQAIGFAVVMLALTILMNPPSSLEAWIGLVAFLALAAGLLAFCYFVLGWRFTDDQSE